MVNSPVPAGANVRTNQPNFDNAMFATTDTDEDPKQCQTQ